MNNRRSPDTRTMDYSRSQYGADNYRTQNTSSDYSRDYQNHRQPADSRSDLHRQSLRDDRFEPNTDADETFLDDYRRHHDLPELPREHSRFEPDDDFKYFENGNKYSQQYVARKDVGFWESMKDSMKSHFGKGPKGYKKSDERIHEEVCEMLFRHHHIDASEIEVEVKDGVVFLKGEIHNRQMKRLVEDEVEHCPGVVDIHNLLRVTPGAQV